METQPPQRTHTLLGIVGDALKNTVASRQRLQENALAENPDFEQLSFEDRTKFLKIVRYTSWWIVFWLVLMPWVPGFIIGFYLGVKVASEQANDTLIASLAIGGMLSVVCVIPSFFFFIRVQERLMARIPFFRPR